MTTEKHDPWALLREAHAFVDPYEGDLFERIHAALAAHDAVPPSEEKVEWMPNGPRGLSGYLKGRVEKASAYQTKDGLWWASASDIGPFETLDDAQRAALSAARGMK